MTGHNANRETHGDCLWSWRAVRRHCEAGTEQGTSGATGCRPNPSVSDGPFGGTPTRTWVFGDALETAYQTLGHAYAHVGVWVKHFSASSASTYLSCPAKWKYRYIDHLSEVPSEAMERGTMVHKAMERYWTGDYGKPEAGIHRYISAYRKLKGGILPEQVAATELELRAELPGVAVPMLGYIDVLTKNGLVVDLKTAAKPWWDGRAVTELQPALYTFLARANGYEVHGFEFHVLVNEAGTHNVSGWRIPVKVDADFVEEHLERVVKAWQGIVAGEFPPKKSVLCGFCAYEFICGCGMGIEPGRGTR